MKKEKYIKVEAEIAASLDQVWNCWTSPDHIVHWNAASDEWYTPRASNDLRVRGKFNYRMEAKDGSMGFNFEGVYTIVNPLKKIEYEMLDGRKAIISFINSGQSIKVIELFQPENINSEELQQQGWQSILDNFKNYVETLV